MKIKALKNRISVLLIVSMILGTINPVFAIDPLNSTNNPFQVASPSISEGGAIGKGVPRVDKETGVTTWYNNETVADDDEAYQIAIQNTANYIYYLIKKYNNSDYYLLGEKPVFNITPKGSGWEQYDINNKTDEYPNGKPLWKIIHNPEYFSNSMGICANTGDYVPSVVKGASSSEPICEFDRTGSYEVYYGDELLNTIKVHRKPIANFRVEIGDANATSISQINFTTKDKSGNNLSYDLDEDKDLGLGLPGITGEKYEYKTLTNNTWSPTVLMWEKTLDNNGNEVLKSDKILNEWDRSKEIILVKHTVYDNQLNHEGKGQENFSVKYIGEGDPIADFTLWQTDVSNFIPLRVIQNSYDPSGLEIKQYNWEILDINGNPIETFNDIEIDDEGYITKVYDTTYNNLTDYKEDHIQENAKQYALNTSTASEPRFQLDSTKYVNGQNYMLKLTVFNEAYATSTPADKLAGKNKSQSFSRQFTYHKQKLVIDPNGGTINDAQNADIQSDGTGILEIKQKENTEIHAPNAFSLSSADGNTTIHRKFLYWDLSGNGRLVEKSSGNTYPEDTQGNEVYLYTIGSNIKDTIKAIWGIGYTLRFHYPHNGSEKIQEMDILYNSNRQFPAVTVIPQDAETWDWFYKPTNIKDETDIDEWIQVKDTNDTDKFFNRINNRYIDIYYKTKNVIVISPDDLEEGEYRHIGWTRATDSNSEFNTDTTKEPLYVHKIGGELEVLTRTVESVATDSNLNKSILIQTSNTSRPPKVKGWYTDKRKDHVYKEGVNVIIDFFPVDNPDVTLFMEEFENVLFYIDYGFEDGKVYKYNLSDLLKEENNNITLSTLSEIPLYEHNPQTPPTNSKWDDKWRYSKKLNKPIPVYKASSSEVIDGLIEDLERIRQTHVER